MLHSCGVPSSNIDTATPSSGSQSSVALVCRNSDWSIKDICKTENRYTLCPPSSQDLPKYKIFDNDRNLILTIHRTSRGETTWRIVENENGPLVATCRKMNSKNADVINAELASNTAAGTLYQVLNSLKEKNLVIVRGCIEVAMVEKKKSMFKWLGRNKCVLTVYPGIEPKLTLALLAQE